MHRRDEVQEFPRLGNFVGTDDESGEKGKERGYRGACESSADNTASNRIRNNAPTACAVDMSGNATTSSWPKKHLRRKAKLHAEEGAATTHMTAQKDM